MKNLYNQDFEKSVLASLMSIEHCYATVADIIQADDFAISKHRLLFNAVKALSEAGDSTDCVMVADYLTRTSKLEQAGGVSYLAEILSTSPASMSKVENYAKRIKSLSKQRRLRQAFEEARLSLNDDDDDVDTKVNNAIAQLISISSDGNSEENEPQSITELMGGFFQRLSDLKDGKKPPFIPTGFIELDLKAPIENGDLVIIAARPSMGKTTFVMNIAENITASQCTFNDKGDVVKRKSCVFFSLEMDKASVVTRFMASQSSVNMGKIRSGQNLDEDDWAGMMRTATLHKDGFPLMVDDRSRVTHQQIRSTLNKLKSKGHEIGMVIVDYIQIMGNVNPDNESSSIGDITANLKAIGKDFCCPIITLAQLNRNLEARPNKRPVNSDLKSSGSIEQDADLIMFLYRDEVYNENSEHKGVAEVIIGKNRQGEIGTVRLGFEGKYSRFTNFINHDIEEGYNQYGYT